MVSLEALVCPWQEPRGLLLFCAWSSALITPGVPRWTHSILETNEMLEPVVSKHTLYSRMLMMLSHRPLGYGLQTGYKSILGQNTGAFILCVDQPWLLWTHGCQPSVRFVLFTVSLLHHEVHRYLGTKPPCKHLTQPPPHWAV